MAKGVVKVGIGIVIVIVIAVAGAGAYYFGRIAPLIKSGKKEANYADKSRPDVSAFGYDTGKGAQKIKDLNGKVIVMDVWATWCGPCIRSMPDVVALRNKYTGQPVEVIGLNVDSNGWNDVKPFLQRHREVDYTMAVPSPAPSFLLQSIVDLKPLGDVSAIPTIFVIDQHGKLAAKFVESDTLQQVDDLVARLLNEESSTKK